MLDGVRVSFFIEDSEDAVSFALDGGPSGSFVQNGLLSEALALLYGAHFSAFQEVSWVFQTTNDFPKLVLFRVEKLVHPQAPELLVEFEESLGQQSV